MRSLAPKTWFPFVLLAGAVIGVAGSQAFGGWVFTGAGWRYFPWAPGPEECPCSAAWAFPSDRDVTTTDPDWPPAVLGETGPWVWSAQPLNPFGDLMPHTGIAFEIEPGGVPITEPESTWFVVPCEGSAEEVPGPVMLYYLDPAGGITEVLDPADEEPIIDPYIPPELTEPEEIYQYILDNYIIPEPATLTLLALGGLAALKRRRS